MSVAIGKSLGMGRSVGISAKPRFGLFDEVIVNDDRFGGVLRGWITGIEYYDPLSEAAATNNRQECLKVRDVAASRSGGSWEYVISLQLFEDWAAIAEAEVQEAIQVSECCLAAA